MIDKFCDWITEKIKAKVSDIDEEREMIINFGVRLIFGELPKILILFIIGFALKMGWQTLLLFFLIAPYRSFTGGIHLKTHLGCMLTTSCLYLGPIIVTKYFQINNDLILYVFTAIITIFSIFIIAKYAPADTENIPILTKKERKAKTYINQTILGINENEEEILKLISQNLKEKWDISRISKVNTALLKLATYEIVYAKLPYKVVVNEVVEIAKKYGDENSPSFINGILANIIKQTGITNEE